jgi:hypothetical protein
VTRTSRVTKEIRDGLDALDRYWLSLEELRGRTTAVDAAEDRLLNAAEAAVSMCHHLATRLAESYADRVSALAEAASSRRIWRNGWARWCAAGTCSSISRNEWCVAERHERPI